MAEWVATNISISERAAGWRLFTIGQALIGAIRLPFVLRLSLNQPVSLRFIFLFFLFFIFFSSLSAHFIAQLSCAGSQLQQILLKNRPCSNTGAPGLFPGAAARPDGARGWRNQRPPRPVYFIIHCIAKLRNIFPPNELETSYI